MNKITDNLNNKQHTLAKLVVRGTELSWFKNYLSQHQQFVVVNGQSSSLLHILFGVPYGSILGPLLFLIYNNDLSNCSKLRSFSFTDDTTLLDSDSDISKLVTRVNSEFRKVVYYFRARKLALHPNKTKFIVFSHANFNNLPLIVNIDFNNFSG
jgi:hypothetical protein